ncbi:hypothetical protein ABZZ79_14590 [Streptomyces sp. NPDC006458]|uniref:hypothetical protein n=1 Tax=Streptomyces sp. NPDC006458 TaxID=3154302 RepID=UPI0033AAB695
MGRRTGWWPTGAQHGRLTARALPGALSAARARVAASMVCAAALGALTGTYAQPAAAAGTPGGYAFADDARPVTAAENTTGAERLQLGGTYRSSVGAGTQVYYRLDLDAASDAYVAATAVPPAGTSVSTLDGIKVSVQDVDGGVCDQQTKTFGSVHSARPITAGAVRELTSRRSRCQEAGTYYVVVEAVRSDDEVFAPDDWELELVTVSEPKLARSGATEAPDSWNSAPPSDLTGDPRPRTGGAGFGQATRLGQGVWEDEVRPGQTLFYEVPLGWGRQLYATAELGSSPGGSGATAGALDLTLYNPVRGPVEDERVGYFGRQQSAELDPLPPVAHENRFAVSDRVSGMRFAGSYYLVVHLADQVAERFGDEPLGLTLRVRVEGVARSGPDYAGESEPEGLFEVEGVSGLPSLPGSEGQGTAAAEGTADDDMAMTALAAGGIGGGTALLAGLVVWTVAARRRAG